jgi:hypothetical protein
MAPAQIHSSEVSQALGAVQPKKRRKGKFIVLDSADNTVRGRMHNCDVKECKALLKQIKPGTYPLPGGVASRGQRRAAKGFIWVTPFRCARFGIFLPDKFPRAERLRKIYTELLAKEESMQSAGGAR